MKKLFSLIALIGLCACSENIEQSQSETMYSNEAERKINQNRNINVVDEVKNEEGETEYYIVKERTDNFTKKYAIHKSGRETSIAEAQRYEEKIHTDKWGRLAKSSVSVWENADDEQLLAVSILFYPKCDQARVTDILDENEIIYESPKTKCLSIHFQDIKRNILDRYAFKDDIASVDLEVLDAKDEPPKNNTGEQFTVAQTSAGYTDTYREHNLDGRYASGVKVGITEYQGRGGRFFEEHQSLSGVNITYQVPAKTCEVGTNQCNETDGSTNPNQILPTYARNALCYDPDGDGVGECVLPHPSWVASRISSTVDDNIGHAGQIELYFPNDASRPLKLSTSRVEKRYDWFVDNGVDLVNESYSTYSDLYTDYQSIDLDSGIVTPDLKANRADFYSRTQDMLIVMSAGNRWFRTPGNEFGGYTDNNDVLCQQLNGLCVGSVDANDVYASQPPYVTLNPLAYRYNFPYFDNTLAPSSRWGNPRNNDGSYKDVERPDIVSEGEDAWVMNVLSFDTDGWMRAGGTSFAAPTVTGMIAIDKGHRQDCGYGDPSSLMWRAMYRNRAWAAQRLNSAIQNNPPFGSTFVPTDFYPIPGYSPDSKAGLGIVLQERFVSCSSNPPYDSVEPQPVETQPTHLPNDLILDHERGGIDMRFEDLTSGWEEPPSYFVNEVTDDDIENISVVRQSLGAQKGNFGNIRVKPIATVRFDNQYEGYTNEIRASLAFNNCSSAFNDNIRMSVDYDLALCVDDLSECMIVSESYEDTNEGFHAQIPAELTGQDLTFYLIRPAEVMRCAFDDYENWAFAYDKFSIKRSLLPY